MIRHDKFISLIGINELLLWFHTKNFTSHNFLESNFVYQLGLTRIHLTIPFLSLIRHHEFIILVGINDTDALVSYEKNSLSTIFGIKVYFSTGINVDSHNNLLSFNDWAPQINSTDQENELMLWFHRKTSYPTIFQSESSSVNWDKHEFMK